MPEPVRMAAQAIGYASMLLTLVVAVGYGIEVAGQWWYERRTRRALERLYALPAAQRERRRV